MFQSPTADPDFVATGRRLVGHVTHVMGHLHAKFQKDRTSGFRDMAGDSRTDGRTEPELIPPLRGIKPRLGANKAKVFYKTLY